MAIVTVLVLLAAIGLWQIHRRYATRRRQVIVPSRLPVQAAQHDPVVMSAQRCAGQQDAPALTEDDVIAFGLVLEATDDVVEELLADKE